MELSYYLDNRFFSLAQAVALVYFCKQVSLFTFHNNIFKYPNSEELWLK